MPARLVSVDNVLQYSSEIPSGQTRGPPSRRPQLANQRSNSFAGASAGARIAPQNVPGRSTKISEKLVLIPETLEERDGEDEDVKAGFKGRYGDESEDEGRPLMDEELDELKKRGALRGKSYAERLPKAKRTEKVARVTAYCTAEGYKLRATTDFVKEKHGAKTKLYDDALYTVYHLPLLPGAEGYRIRSSPILKNPGGKAVLDEEIERSERRDYHEGYFEDTDVYGVRGGEENPQGETEDARNHREEEEKRSREETRALAQGKRADSPNRIAPDATTFAEMFVFTYGVVVFWNFTEHQEKDILADLTFAETKTGLSLMSRPQNEMDFETEELHFEYNPLVDRPRIFNDMITLRSGDHMIKLAMSHAIAQSTKLSFFEERMSQTMLDAQYVPKRLALTGQLGMSRKEIVKILGRLFKSRVDVNLCKLSLPSFAVFHLFPNFLTPFSLQHPRRPQLLLGRRTYTTPTVHRDPGIPRNHAAHQSAQRAVSRVFGSRRDPLGQYCRRQNEQYHLDHHCAHRHQYFCYGFRGRAALWTVAEGKGGGSPGSVWVCWHPGCEPRG
jgi:uncharacterized Rmd1/YagE family protein